MRTTMPRYPYRARSEGYVASSREPKRPKARRIETVDVCRTSAMSPPSPGVPAGPQRRVPDPPGTSPDAHMRRLAEHLVAPIGASPGPNGPTQGPGDAYTDSSAGTTVTPAGSGSAAGSASAPGPGGCEGRNTTANAAPPAATAPATRHPTLRPWRKALDAAEATAAPTATWPRAESRSDTASAAPTDWWDSAASDDGNRTGSRALRRLP